MLYLELLNPNPKKMYVAPKRQNAHMYVAVLRIQIRRIHMFLGLLDPDPLVKRIRILYHQAKIVTKTLNHTVLWLRFDL
jgi:hypothetical protein